MPGRGQLARDLCIVGLVFATSAGWVLAPAVVRHLAGADPLLYETVPIAGAEPAGGAAWRAILPETGIAAAPRDLELLERGTPLARARPREVREEGGGRFAVGTGGELLFAPSTAAPPDVRDYSVRQPRTIPPAIADVAALSLIVLTVVSLLVMLRGLARSQVLGRTAAGVAIALGGWFAVAAAVETTIPWLGSDLIGQKLGVLAEDVHDYHAVFLGSSRIYRQLDPVVFDRVFEDAGRAMRSFNLGAPDMRMPEVLYLARWLIDQSPRRLELLVVDAESDPLFIREQNLRSERIVRWHDPRNVAAILGEVRRSSGAPALALHRAGRHSAPFLLHLTQLGRGHGLLLGATGALQVEFPLEQRGFFAGDEELAITPSAAQRQELELFSSRLHGDLDRWRRDIERLSGLPRSGELTDPFEIELFTELERLAASAGVRTVFLLDARPEQTPNLVWAAENDVVSTLLRFDDPHRYPELYDPALRFDRHHLTREGARIYTTEVARRILEPDQQGPPAPTGDGQAPPAPTGDGPAP
jgi:hypothetical protein